MNQKLRFPLKVWLSSVLIGPLLLLFNVSNEKAVMFNADITKIIDYVFSGEFVIYYAIAVVIGGICSIPCFLLLWLCFSLLNRGVSSILKIRFLLVPVCLISCTTIFLLFSLSDPDNFWRKGNIIMISAYAIPLIFGLFIYKIKLRRDPVLDPPEKEPLSE